VPAGARTIVLRGLPAGMHRDALRVRADGAEVTGVELRERIEARTPAERIAELAARIEAVEARLAELADETAVLAGLERHVEGLFRVEERAFAARLSGASAGDPGRGARQEWLGERLAELATARRALSERREEAERELADLRAQLGGADRGAGTRVVDLHVELAGAGPATLTAEYLVADAGWTPAYELRTPKDLSKVELVYRADVRQGTGEDWTDVELWLSTAEPQRGARGPEPHVTRLDLVDPARTGDDSWFLGQGERGVAPSGPSSPGGPPRPSQAEVVDMGLSVRYRLPRRETVESRSEASRVLIGRADLAVEPEHVVVPALDTTVWLRGRSRNTSPWVLLPGSAAVYFGNDFLGSASLPAVQRSEELVLHLGPDPGIVVERTVLAEETEESGMFSSRATWRQALRLRVKNTGGLSAAADRAVVVTVHESIPRSTDERVKVALDDVEPRPAEGARWDELREERGVETWLVRVPRGQERVIELAVEIAYPEDLELHRW
jgi:uncharacterized protein (TIGR02231 family)